MLRNTSLHIRLKAQVAEEVEQYVIFYKAECI